MDKIYKIKRKKDGRFYKGKSKFTKHGSFFRREQIIHNIEWIMKKYPDEEIELLIYNVGSYDKIDIDLKSGYDSFVQILERNEKINQILNG